MNNSENAFAQALQDLLEYMAYWHEGDGKGPPAAESCGRIPPCLRAQGGGHIPPSLTASEPTKTLKEILDDLRIALVDPTVPVEEQQRLHGMSSILSFTLSWEPVWEDDTPKLKFEVQDLRQLVSTLQKF